MKSMELVKQNTLIFTPFSPLKIWKHKENEKLKEEKWIVEVPHMDHNVVHVVQVWNVPQNVVQAESVRRLPILQAESVYQLSNLKTESVNQLSILLAEAVHQH